MNTQQLIMVSSYLQALEVNDTLYLDDDFEYDEGGGYIGPAYVSMPGSYDHQLIIYFKEDGFYFRNHELDPIDENGVPTSIAIKSLRHLLDLIYTSKGKGDEHHKRLEARNQLRRAGQEVKQEAYPPSVTLSREEFVEALRESAAPAQPEVSDEEDYPHSYSTDSEYDLAKKLSEIDAIKQRFSKEFRIPIDRVTMPIARNRMLNEMYEWGEKAVIDRTHLSNVPPKAFWKHVDKLMDKIAAQKECQK